MVGIEYHDALHLLGATVADYTANQMTYDLRRLRLKGLIYRPSGTNRYFITPHGWKVARLFSRLEARVFRPVMAFTAGAMKKAGYRVESFKPVGGDRTYRIKS